MNRIGPITQLLAYLGLLPSIWLFWSDALIHNLIKNLESHIAKVIYDSISQGDEKYLQKVAQSLGTDFILIPSLRFSDQWRERNIQMLTSQFWSQQIEFKGLNIFTVLNYTKWINKMSYFP